MTRDDFIAELERYASVGEDCKMPESRLSQSMEHQVMCELRDAGLVHVEYAGSSLRLIVGRSITYAGRLELARLKDERKRDKWWYKVGTLTWVAIGYLIATFAPLLNELVKVLVENIGK